MSFTPSSRLMPSMWFLPKSLVKKPNSQLLRFSSSNFTTLPLDQKIEEATYDSIPKGRFYPVRIGDILNNQYQVLGKLGYGLGSTVWLANDIEYVS